MSEPAPEEFDGDETVQIPRPTEPPASAGTGFASVLRNRPFLSIWTAQVTSQTAQNSLWYSLIIMVGRLTGQTALSIGFTIILVQLPTVLFSSISGVLVDRVSKRMILVGTNGIRVAGVLLYILFEHNLAGLYLVTFLVAVVSQPFAPAEGSSLPLLVKGNQLITANSLFQSTFMGSQAVGFAVAPVAIGFLGIRTTLLILAGLFAFAAAVLVPLPAVTAEGEGLGGLSLGELARGFWDDLVEVVRYILRDPPLAVALLQIALAPTLLLVLAEVGPSFLTDNLHIQQTSTSLFFLLAPAGLGLGIGIAILGQWGHRLRKDRLVLVSLIALGVTVIGLASVPTIATLWQSLAGIGLQLPRGVQLTVTIVIVAMLMGIEVSFINAPVQTIVQERAAPEIRGRVLAMQQTLTAAMAIPPLIVVGSVAAIFGTPATLALMGVGIVVVGLGIVYYS